MSYPYESNKGSAQAIISSNQDNPSLVKDIYSTPGIDPSLVSASASNMANENFVSALGHLSNISEVGITSQPAVIQSLPQNSSVVNPLFNTVLQNQAGNMHASVVPNLSSQPISTTLPFSVHAAPISNPLISSGGVTAGLNAPSITTSTVSKPNLKVEDALTYLDLVKARFFDKNAIYMDFLDVMREFKAQTIDTQTVIMRVRQLFEGHKDLIDGFNTFLPPGSRMDAPLPPIGASVGISATESLPVSTLSSISNSANSMPTVSISSLTAAGIRLPGVVQSTSSSQHYISIGTLSGLSAAATGGNIITTNASSLGHSFPEGTSSLLRAPLLSNIQQTAPSSQLSKNSTVNRSGGTVTALQAQSSAYPPSASPAGDMLMTVVPSQGSIQSANTNAPVVAAPTGIAPPSQFNQAISYVNNIKSRFLNQPEVYKRFLEILHCFQKEGSKNPNPQLRKSTEREVYEEVAKLFKGQDDLLIEFNLFLSDSTGVPRSMADHDWSRDSSRKGSAPYVVSSSDPGRSGLIGGSTSRNLAGSASESGKAKRSSADQDESGSISGASISRLPPTKKIKTQRDVSLTEIGQLGNSQDYAFFNKVRKSVKYPKNFESFLQLIELYNRSLIDEEELIGQVERILRPFPDLVAQLREMLGPMLSTPPGISSVASSGLGPVGVPISITKSEATDSGEKMSMIGQSNRPKDRSLTTNGSGDIRNDLDLVQLEMCGVSYRMLPKDFPQPKCSGRINNPICQQVLNDTYVSFSSMSSEDSQFVTSKKSVLEENVYRVEDERYEVDMVVELNRAAISNFVAIQKKMDKMSSEDLQRFQLDDNLGGTSAILQRKSIQRIYGDKVNEIKLGLMRSPSVAVPLVLARLREKDEEWKQSLKKFHRNWRDQDAKYYLKSLDHQGQTFKQKDVPNLRSKTLINHIECLAEVDSNGDSSFVDDNNCLMSWRNVIELAENSHITLEYSERPPFEDAATLMIHHVKRQSSSSKEDKREMKALIRGPLQELLHSNRFPLSDDEEEEEADNEQFELMPPLDDKTETSNRSEVLCEQVDSTINDNYLKNIPQYEHYNLFYASSSWYVFLRLHHILCERLTLIRNLGEKMADEARAETEKHPEASARTQVAEVLRLKKAAEFGPDQYYRQALGYIRDLLDGGDDSSSFEDRMRDLFGIHAYPWFTMDKLIQCLVRQLQALVSEDLSRQLINLYRQVASRGGAGGSIASAETRFPKERAYFIHAAKFNGGNNLYRIITFKNSQKVSITLLKPPTINSMPLEAESTPAVPVEVSTAEAMDLDSIVVRNWSSYLARYSRLEASKYENSSVDNAAMEALTGVSRRAGSPVFLIKSVRSYLLQLAQSILERKRMNLLEGAGSQPLLAIDDYKEDLLARLSGNLAEVSNIDEEEDDDDDTENVIKEDVKDEEMTPTNEQMSHENITDAVDSKMEEAPTESVIEASNQEVARKQRISQVKNWQSDTCDLLKNVFKLTLPRKELFRDTVCTDCMKAKNWSGKYRISWSAGSYGIFIRKSRACKQSSQSKTVLEKKASRFRDRHDNWVKENCTPENIKSIDMWLSDLPPETATVEQTIPPTPEADEVSACVEQEISSNLAIEEHVVPNSDEV